MAGKNLILFSFLLMIGCGSGSKPITAADVFTLKMTGQTWVFVDSYGDHMFISIENPPAGFYPGCSVWHYTKDNARGYWFPGAAGAEHHFVLCEQLDGSWASVAFLASIPPIVLTQNIDSSGDGKIPYLIIPASGSVGVRVSDDTAYTSYRLYGQMTWDSIRNQVTPKIVPWRTDSYVEMVTTPSYTGPALVSEQWEAFDGSCFPTEQPGCLHEKWYFAPNLGLVKVIPLDIGSGNPADPNLTMLRIN